MVVFARAICLVVALSVLTVCYGLELSDDCERFSHKIINMTNFNLEKYNTVLSPFVIWNFFFTVALVASGNTANQILSALGLSHETENTIIKANKLLNKKVVQNDITGINYTSGSYMFWDNTFQINIEFKAIVNYGLEIENQDMDFSNSTAAAVVARGVLATSKVKFEDILSVSDFKKSRMILVTTTSFEGLWKSPFNPLDTTIQPFYSEEGQIIRQVYMMSQRNRFPFSNVIEVGAFVLQLPYGSSDKYSMLILLPSPHVTVKEVCQNLIRRFTLKDILNKLSNDTRDYGLDNIDIRIPRFEIVTNRDTQRLINDIGVYDLFDSRIANFSRTTSESIFVSMIRRKANIKITESGTSASASATALFTDELVLDVPISGVQYRRTIKPDPVYSPAFIANRPFAYYVLEKETAAVIFGGAFSEIIAF